MQEGGVGTSQSRHDRRARDGTEQRAGRSTGRHPSHPNRGKKRAQQSPGRTAELRRHTAQGGSTALRLEKVWLAPSSSVDSPRGPCTGQAPPGPRCTGGTSHRTFTRQHFTQAQSHVDAKRTGHSR